MKRLLLCFALLLAAVATNAQVTTSSINGKVTAKKENLVGATIIALHSPSGTEYGTTSNSEGLFTISGMRVGGPYTITISFIGYEDYTLEDIYLDLGDHTTINASLNEDLTLVEEVVVNAQWEYKPGVVSEIESIPTVKRSIYDVTKLVPGTVNPKAGGVVIGGQSTRYNAFTIDGTPSADIYGLGTTGMIGSLTNANPIPLDAIETVRVISSSVDLRNSGFTGGGINAITKSGSNTFRGSAYTYFNNEQFYGTTPGRNIAERKHLAEQMTSIVGATLEGAIVRNRLFFFLAGEFNRNLTPSTNYPATGISALTITEAERIAQHYKSLTGYDGGGYGHNDILALTGSAVARLDWNINRRNQLSVRYNMLHADADAGSNSAQSFYFSGAEYTNINRTHSAVVELHSYPADHISNNLRVGYTYLRDGRTTVESLPAVIINGLGERSNGTATIGTNPYSGRNMLKQNIFTLHNDLDITIKRHNIGVGIAAEIYRADNLYLANARGTYTYASLDDFLADDGTSAGHASQYAYNYFLDGKQNPPMTMGQFALYVQDEVTFDNLALTYGLRADIPVMFNTPVANEAFNKSDFATKYGTKTGDIPRTQILLSPRIGIEWGARNFPLHIEANAGIYTGRIPFVWLSNCYQNTGIRSVGVTVNKQAETPAFSLNPESVGIASNPAIDLVDSNFRYPQVFRAALNLRYRLGQWRFSLSGDYTKGLNNIFVENLAAENRGERLFVGGDGSEASTVYYTSTTKDYSAVYRLSNTQKGYSWSATARIQRDNIVPHLHFSAAYTFSQSRSINDGISAQSSSNWGRTYAVESNNPDLARSVYEFPHSVVATLSYTPRYGKSDRFGSDIMLLYSGHSGEHYSLSYARGKVDENGDTYRGNSLIYIPTEAEMSTMLWADDSSAAAFNDYIKGDKYLRSHRGRFAERNSHSLPFEHRLDLHIAQSFYYGNAKSVGQGRRVVLSLDIINLSNLISRSWGLTHRTSNWTLSPVTVTELQSVDGGYRPVYKFTGAEYTVDDVMSRWHMQIGVKVVF